MTLTIKPIQALKDNYIWMLADESTGHTWVVDPGESQPVLAELHKRQLTLVGMLVTHHHYDHSGGVTELLTHFKQASVYASHKSLLPFITHPVKENDTIQCLDNLKLGVMEIPGHTLDHTAFYNDEMVFCGDTLFSAGCGRIFEGTAPMMYQSLSKLSALPSNTQIFCGHEYTAANLQFAVMVEPTNTHIIEKIKKVNALRKMHLPTLPSVLAEERLINPFLRSEQSSVIAAVEKKFNKTLKDPIEVFHHLREWKNHST